MIARDYSATNDLPWLMELLQMDAKSLDGYAQEYRKALAAPPADFKAYTVDGFGQVDHATWMRMHACPLLNVMESVAGLTARVWQLILEAEENARSEAS